MPLIRCTNVIPRETIPSHYFPLREDSSRVLAWELHGLGNPGPAVVIIPPLPPNVTNSRAKPQQSPSVEKPAHPPRVVYCAIPNTYSIHKVSSLKFICILQALNMPLIRCTNVIPREAIPSHTHPLGRLGSLKNRKPFRFYIHFE